MEERGLFENTMIVFSSDHGDYLGDHWMGEKDFFHEPSVRVPLIIYDPRKDADSTRGTASSSLVEGIDLAATFLDYFGSPAKPHIIEGRSLNPLLHGDGKPARWREVAISEYDYATRFARVELGIEQEDARLIMAFDGRWKYIHCEGFRPVLFDLETDPEELTDLGEDPRFEDVRVRLFAAIGVWSRKHHNRITKSPEDIARMSGREPQGVLIGIWDEADYEKTYKKPFNERP
jgi:arylsulfatase A-like enzyme